MRAFRWSSPITQVAGRRSSERASGNRATVSIRQISRFGSANTRGRDTRDKREEDTEVGGR
jgi:hypothetical protein